MLLALNVITYAIKVATGRTLPWHREDLLYVGGLGYPSGHTANATAILAADGAAHRRACGTAVRPTAEASRRSGGSRRPRRRGSRSLRSAGTGSPTRSADGAWA